MKRKRPMTAFVLGMAAVVVIGAVAIGTLISRKGRQPLTEVDMKGNPSQARGYVFGDTTAPVQIIEFADFECPACGQFATLTEPDVRKRLVQTKQAYVRFFDYPLPMHRNTWDASHAAACADEQGKFWQMHDTLFANQDRWNGEATSSPKTLFMGYARELGLNEAQFETCWDSRKYQARIASNRAEAERRHVSQTPSFIIANKLIPGALGYDEIKNLVSEAAGSPPVVSTPPAGPRPLIASPPATRQ